MLTLYQYLLAKVEGKRSARSEEESQRAAKENLNASEIFPSLIYHIKRNIYFPSLLFIFIGAVPA
jgi:hypothetical protein